MGYLEFCSNCGSYNKFGTMDGNDRFYCLKCNIIHYENPKPTATIICTKGNDLLLAKRALEKKITKVFFDRGRFKYHGRIKLFAETLRKNGLNF